MWYFDSAAPSVGDIIVDNSSWLVWVVVGVAAVAFFLIWKAKKTKK